MPLTKINVNFGVDHVLDIDTLKSVQTILFRPSDGQLESVMINVDNDIFANKAVSITQGGRHDGFSEYFPSS